MKKVLSLVLLTLACVLVFSANAKNEYQRPKLSNLAFNPAEINEAPTATHYISYTDFITAIHTKVRNNEITDANDIKVLVNQGTENGVTNTNPDDDIFVRIDSAEELYRFSVDVSYEYIYASINLLERVKFSETIIEGLLSIRYVLGNDIDYSNMKSKLFIPIGYAFTLTQYQTYHENIFKGEFDGRGFEIRNLYVAGYDYITTKETTGANITVETALTNYYAMFNYNQGTIKNLGLLNPNLELLSYHQHILWTANLVGENQADGVVRNVYVIDNRTLDYAGIRFRVPTGTSGNQYTAGGIINHNLGIFDSSYYASRVVVNLQSLSNFEVEALVYDNDGPEGDLLVYDETLYETDIYIYGNLLEINPPTVGVGETTTVLRSSNSILAEDENWHFYGTDTYPLLMGLYYDSVAKKYHISSARDLIIFSKIVNFVNPLNNKALYASDYILTNDINMNELAEGAYKTPEVEFSGTFSGLKNGNENYYIYNFSIVNGPVSNGVYSSGLFSSLKGTVSNITFSNASIKITDSSDYYSSIFNIGIVTGRLSGGTITKVSADINIDLGTTSIGKTYLGGIVGRGNGIISEVYVKGNLIPNNHIFGTNHTIVPEYNIGGIIGAAEDAKVTIYQALNRANIEGISSSAAIKTNSTKAFINIGGIVGLLKNDNVTHDFRQLKNEGNITFKYFQASISIDQNAGGIFGLYTGKNMTMYKNLTTAQVINEAWINTGLVDAVLNVDEETTIENTTIRSAGIGVSNSSEPVEFVYLENSGSFITNSFDYFNYTGLIYNISDKLLTLSQSINAGNFTISPYKADFSPVVYSEDNSVNILLRYVENSGNITFKDYTSSTITTDTYIVGITQNTNVEYVNVYYSGTIKVYNLNITQKLWVAGFTTTLVSGRSIRNSMNEGKIMVGQITNTANTYIAGFVNNNNSGDLNSVANTNSSQPKASYGIINSINFADILSTVETATDTYVYGFQGIGNVYSGGITTLNKGSIQDSANMGNIKMAHISDYTDTGTYIKMLTKTAMAGLVNYELDKGISGGVYVSGIAAVVTEGTSRIYDCSNNGEIVGLSYNFVRSGGILGVCLYEEAKAGVVDGAVDTIENSILSNCINYGNVFAITSTISTYDNTETTATGSSMNYFPEGKGLGSVKDYPTRVSTSERPGIYACAGGVIGYGLSIMKRMINHGVIMSTDVAGGVIGATYAIGIESGKVQTVVNINTAIHYGKVQAIKNSKFIDIRNKIHLSYDDIVGTDEDLEKVEENLRSFNVFDDENYHFYFPITVNNNRLSQFPESKRGFGGIFGRLQRGTNGEMTSANGSFNYIVNTDKNVDLIGRLDQVYNFTSSARYFLFKDCIYYSARPNDTTQAVFAGYTYNVYEITTQAYFNLIISETKLTYVRGTKVSGRTYNWTETKEIKVVSGYCENIVEKEYGKTVANVNTTHKDVISRSITPLTSGTTISITRQFTSTNSFSDSTTTHSPAISHDNVQISNRVITHTWGPTAPIPLITENEGEPGSFMYDDEFAMRDPNTKISDTEYITSYIYYAPYDILSDTFKETRKNGMYVLSTTAGSTNGSVIPSNMNITNIYRLKNRVAQDENYSAVKVADKQAFNQTIETTYLSMFQTQYNDKSALIPPESGVVLEEISGSEVKLIKGVFDTVNKKLTYTVSLDLFSDEQEFANFKVAYANISAKALVAASNYDNYYYPGTGPNDPARELTAAEFRNMLHSEKDSIISTKLIPSLVIDFSKITYPAGSNNSNPLPIGSFRVYSEAAVNDVLFLDSDKVNIYSTLYTVEVIFKKRTTSGNPIYLNTVQVNNVNSTPIGLTTFTNNYTTYAISSLIKLNFVDSQNIFINDYDIKDYVRLNYVKENGELVEVDNNYYTLDSQPVSSGNFSITISPSILIRGGDYVIQYKYFGYQTTYYELTFYKAPSTAAAVNYLEHYSFYDYEKPEGLAITSEVNFDYNFGFGALGSTIDFQVTTNSGIDVYLHNKTITVLGIEDFYIQISPFATLNSITFESVSYTEENYIGYKVYTLKYSITRESGGIPVIYTHKIYERKLDPTAVYKNNNTVELGNVFATREAVLTTFALDFNVDDQFANNVYKLPTDTPTPLQYFTISVTSPDDINPELGISYNGAGLLYIYMSNESLPGNYDFSFTYHRDGRTINAGTLRIKKNQGVSAYLTDIRFSEFYSSASSLTTIYEAFEDGLINEESIYFMGVYYDGIDYGGADNAYVQHIRINGFVANIPLVSFTPIMIPYLPAGATISRGNLVGENWIGTPEVDINSTPSQINQLAADFTSYTGDDEKIITYRVKSEDTLNPKYVYYHITVRDVVFNVALIFEVKYYDQDAYSSTEFAGKPIIINVKNFNAKYEGEEVILSEEIADTVNKFQLFDEIASYNNNTNLFYVPNSNNRTFGFGPNISGFFLIDVELPKDSSGRTIYQYEILFNNVPVYDISHYLPGTRLTGKYYYVEAGERIRTRYLTIRITNLTTPQEDSKWGLHDYQNSWGN